MGVLLGIVCDWHSFWRLRMIHIIYECGGIHKMIKIVPPKVKGLEFVDNVKLAGKIYQDCAVMGSVAPVRAYIQCSWFSPEEIEFMEKGLATLGQNPTISLKYSHHPLSHQYNDIDVNEHPEVMGDREWQQNTYQMDMHAMYGMDMGIGLFMPSKPDVGQCYEQGVLNALHKPNILIIPDDEKDIPLNLMVGCGNTRIITLSEVKDFDFHDVMFKPYDGKVF